MLWETLNKDLICVDLEAANSFDVFDHLAGKLIQHGCCKTSYLQALKDREVVFPTGVMVDQIGVAIPHTDPEHINKSAIGIATLKEPVNFYHMGTNPEEGMEVPVKFVIMLAIAGRDHLEFLQKAIMLIQDYDLLQKLVTSKDSEDIIELIKTKEESENENN